MTIDPCIAEGTTNRAIVELAIRIERVKREFVKALFDADRGPWMQRRKEGHR